MSQSSYSYSYEDFIKYQNLNNVLPQHLVAYCIKDHDSSMQIIQSQLEDQICNIITSVKKGDNPNDMIFKNMIKFHINTINQTNYQEILLKLKEMEYTSKSNIHFLATELIRCSISCPISFKGFNLQEESTHKYIPELCTDIAKQFSSFKIKINDDEISFHNELLAICQQYFVDFLDPNKNMDEHNTYNADNYKGFMTFLGLLYSKNIIPDGIVTRCLTLIKNTIFTLNSSEETFCKRSSVECNNFYKGYEHLLNHVMHTFNLKIPKLIKSVKEKDSIIKNIENILKIINDNYQPEDNKIIDNIFELLSKKYVNIQLKTIVTDEEYSVINDELLNSTIQSRNDLFKLMHEKSFVNILIRILNSDIDSLNQINNTLKISLEKIYTSIDTIIDCHQDMMTLNSQYKALDSRNQLVVPLRNFVVLTHNISGANLNKLHDSFHILNKHAKKYVPFVLPK